MLPPMNPGRLVRIVLALLAAGAVAVTGGTWAYLNLIRDEAPAKLTLNSAGATEATTTVGGTASSAGSATATATAVDGTWHVASGSQAGYRVKEVLFGQSADAVGRTNNVTGTITIAGSRVTAGSFTVDMNSVTSSESRRDSQFRGRIMNTATYPTATFALTAPIDLGSSLPADGATVKATAKGKLTLHGATRDVSVPVEARRSGSTIAVAGSIPVVFADYGISNPSGGPAQTENNGVVEFRLDLAR
jgi:polyisoprenoid-binding protein YceI